MEALESHMKEEEKLEAKSIAAEKAAKEALIEEEKHKKQLERVKFIILIFKQLNQFKRYSIQILLDK